jgi:hypothetical protein
MEVSQKEKLTAAIDVMMVQLEDQLQEVADTKKAINQLRKRLGEPPAFDDVAEPLRAGAAIRRDQYYGQPLATAVQHVLERRNEACDLAEILSELERGAFDFKAAGWKDNDRTRALAISLSKNTQTFNRLPNGSFGLLSWYPEVQKRAKKQGRAQARENGTGDKGEGAVENNEETVLEETVVE